MNIKRFLLINSVALSLLGASIVSAESPSNNTTAPLNKTGHYRQHTTKLLTPKQRSELAKIKKDLRAQMTPLIKEKRALSLQIKGKIATSNAEWSEVAALVKQRNAVSEKISTLWAKTQFQTFQKLGILLPMHHGHHCRVQNKNIAKK
jgi:periplasmic protein CpxP/Spy